MNARWILGALLGAAAALAALTLHGLRQAPEVAAVAPAAGSATAAPGASAGPSATRAASVPPAVADELPPWRAARELAADALPAGAVPVAQIAPPPPDPSTPMPPAPVEPPNPAAHRPPLHTPGGVDGDRPPRVEGGLRRASLAQDERGQRRPTGGGW